MGKLGDKLKAVAQKVGTAVKTGAQNVAQTTQTAAKNVAQTTQTATKNISQTTVAAAKKVAVAASNVAQKTLQVGKKVATLSLFLPMAPIAIVFLKSRGIKPSLKPEEMILQVYNEITKKSFGFNPDDYENSFGYGGDDEFGYADENRAYGVVPVTPEMIIAVISFLKAIFKKIKEKKAAKQALTADEQAVMDQAPAIEQGLTEAKEIAGEVLDDSEALAAAQREKGANDALSILNGGGGSMKWILIILVIVVLVYFFVIKKK